MSTHYELIGQRLRDCRKAQGLTLKELAARTNHLSDIRIGQWERGIREPSIDHLKELARALKISPTYLMGLTDKEEGATINHVRLYPLQTLEILDDKHTITADTRYLAIDTERETVSHHAFATTVEDDALAPNLRQDDIVIADPEQSPAPSDFVIARLKANGKWLIRKYREIQHSNSESFELVALNPDWSNITINGSHDGQLIATIVSCRRYLLKTG